MLNREEIIKKAKSAAFRNANGQVLRTINILREKYNQLEIVQSVLTESGVDVGEFVDAINFLSLEQYIKIRRISDRSEVDIADISFKDCEAKLTAKGIRLIAGGASDDMIEV